MHFINMVNFLKHLFFFGFLLVWVSMGKCHNLKFHPLKNRHETGSLLAMLSDSSGNSARFAVLELSSRASTLDCCASFKRKSSCR